MAAFIKKYLPIFRNRYVLSSLVVLIYILVLHDNDIYTLMKHKSKVSRLETEIQRKKEKIDELKLNIASLQNIRSLEKYARETHFFKKDDEDIFIFSFE